MEGSPQRPAGCTLGLRDVVLQLVVRQRTPATCTTGCGVRGAAAGCGVGRLIAVTGVPLGVSDVCNTRSARSGSVGGFRWLQLKP